jgi:hypothetical protein
MNQRNNAWENPSWWYLLAYWFVIPVIVISIILSVKDAETVKRQRIILTPVIAIDSQNHECLRYKFYIGDSSYTGCGFVKGAKPEDIITVYYDPFDPNRNHTESFQESSRGDLFFLPFCLFTLVASPLFIWWRRRVFRSRNDIRTGTKLLDS